MGNIKGVTILQASIAVISVLIVIGGVSISVAVSLAQGQETDLRHNKRLDQLEHNDAKQSEKSEKRHNEIIEGLYEIKLELKDKKDR